MVYISLLTDVQNVRFVGQRIQQRFLRGGNRFRGERRFQKSHGEREPTSRIFVHFQRLELNGGTYFRISALVSNRFAIIFSSFFFSRFDSNDVRYVPLRKGMDSDATLSLVCRFQQRGTSCTRISRGSLLLLQSRIWT